MSDNIVLLRDGGPSLQDIPAMLRLMADQIEAGEHGSVTSMLVLIPEPDDYPRLFGWGDVEGGNQPVIQLELAKLWMLTNMTARG